MKPVLHVCTTCRAGLPLPDGAVPRGRTLMEAVAAHPLAATVELRGVECLSVCNDGCAAAIAMPGKWGYLLGRLAPEQAGDILDYAGKYAAHPTGTIMPSRRASSLSRMILGRIPA